MKKKNTSSENRNFVSWNRGKIALQRHAPLVLKPLGFSLLITLFWRFVIFQFDLSLEEDHGETIFSLVMAFLFLVYTIFGGYAVNTVLLEYKEMSKAVVKNDLDTFLLYRDENLPILIHILIGTPSVFIILLTLIFPFGNSVMVGMIANFTVGFFLALSYTIVIELDNYKNSIWFKEHIPEAWYKEDVMEYFRKKNNKANPL